MQEGLNVVEAYAIHENSGVMSVCIIFLAEGGRCVELRWNDVQPRLERFSNGLEEAGIECRTIHGMEFYLCRL